MKHQGYGKVVELPKVNDFMGRRENDAKKQEGLKKKMREEGEARLDKKNNIKGMNTHML